MRVLWNKLPEEEPVEAPEIWTVLGTNEKLSHFSFELNVKDKLFIIFIPTIFSMGFTFLMIVLYLWRWGAEVIKESRSFYQDSFWLGALLFLLLPLIVVIHELLHGLVLPREDWKKKVFFVIWPKLFCVQCVYSGVIVGKRKMLLHCLMPFVVLSILPFMVSFLVEFNFLLAAIVVINGVLSCFDLYGSSVVLLGTPRKAIYKSVKSFLIWRPS